MPRLRMTGGSERRTLPSTSVSSYDLIWYPEGGSQITHKSFSFDYRSGVVKPEDLLAEALGDKQTLRDVAVLQQTKEVIEKIWKEVKLVLSLGGLVVPYKGLIYPDYRNSLRLCLDFQNQVDQKVVLYKTARELRGRIDFESEGVDLEDGDEVLVVPALTHRRLGIFSFLLPSDDNVTLYIDWGYRTTLVNDKGEYASIVVKYLSEYVRVVVRDLHLPHLIDDRSVTEALLMNLALEVGKGYLGPKEFY